MGLPIEGVAFIISPQRYRFLRTAKPTVNRRPAPSLIHQFLETSAVLSPQKTAVVQEGSRVAYSDLNGWANRLAHGLVGVGVRPGDRVVLLSENSVAYVVSYYGILKAGAVVASLNTDIKPQALAELVRELEPRAIVVSSKLEKTVRAVDASLLQAAAILVVGPGSPALRPGTADTRSPLPDELAPLPSHNPGLVLDPESCAAIIYTSGSAGKPKGVMLSHANIVANTRSIVEYLELTSGDVQMAVLPFFYVMGKSLLNTHVAVGGTVVINNKFAYTAAVLKQMAKEAVTGFSGVPSTYAHLLFKSPLAAYRNKLPSLRYCSQAGGHMPARVKLELLKVLPEHTRLVIMYGATEASARLTYVPPERLTAKIDSIGVPIAGVTISVMSPDGRALGPGETGELAARGANIMLGYFRDKEATQRALDADGYHTGDLGYRDEDGYFFVTGRKDEQLKVGGHRVNPRTIEDAIAESGQAVECIVFGLPDPLQGYRLAGLVVPIRRTADTVANILQYCAGRLPKFEVPYALQLVDSIPKTSSGKPDRARSVSIFLEGEPTRS
jgi:acyl-CoA synthetase (AMP-forming)/AMP-acid ligase II